MYLTFQEVRQSYAAAEAYRNVMEHNTLNLSAPITARMEFVMVFHGVQLDLILPTVHPDLLINPVMLYSLLEE